VRSRDIQISAKDPLLISTLKQEVKMKGRKPRNTKRGGICGGRGRGEFWSGGRKGGFSLDCISD